MWKNKYYILHTILSLCFLNSDAVAGTVKDIIIGKVIVHPFAQDQLEVGSNIQGNKSSSSPSASGPHGAVTLTVVC